MTTVVPGRGAVSMAFTIFNQLISHSEIWSLNVLLEKKQTLGGLVSGVLQELNVRFYLFQKVLATWYSRFDQCHTRDPPQGWCRACDEDCKAACVIGGNDRHRKEMPGTLKLFLMVQQERGGYCVAERHVGWEAGGISCQQEARRRVV